MTQSKEAQEAYQQGRIHGIREERARIIPAVEGVIGRSVCDGGQYREDIRSAIRLALETERAAGAQESREDLESVVKLLTALTQAARALRENIRAQHEDDPETGICPCCGLAEHAADCPVVGLDLALSGVYSMDPTLGPSND